VFAPHLNPMFEVVAPSDTMDRLFPGVASSRMQSLVGRVHGRESSSYLDIHGRLVVSVTFLPFIQK
jgi:hypothetical protein